MFCEQLIFIFYPSYWNLLWYCHLFQKQKKFWAKFYRGPWVPQAELVHYLDEAWLPKNVTHWSHKYWYVVSKYWSEACLLNDVMNWSQTPTNGMKHAGKIMWPIEHINTDILKTWWIVEKTVICSIQIQQRRHERLNAVINWSHKYLYVVSKKLKWSRLKYC